MTTTDIVGVLSWLTDELRQVIAGLVKHPQGPVTGAIQVHGSIHDATQHRGQLHVQDDGRHQGIQQALNPGLGGAQGAQLPVNPAGSASSRPSRSQPRGRFDPPSATHASGTPRSPDTTVIKQDHTA
ncbi:hypothetical protein [Streptomyces sp. NPDC087437]|uniref:hypothetical protein n=1 Tax=Streptomyces sp. NPDC087437 TaxID=3365789 RepID=UPI00382C18BF